MRALLAWAILTGVGMLVAYAHGEIDAAAAPEPAVEAWIRASLEAARLGAPLPTAPEGARAVEAPSYLLTLWRLGRAEARFRAEGALVEALPRLLAQAYPDDSPFRSRPGAAPAFGVLTIELGEGGTLPGGGWLRTLVPVPLRDALRWRDHDRVVDVSPSELVALRAYDGAVPLPIPEVAVGTSVSRVEDTLRADGRWPFVSPGSEVHPVRVHDVTPRPYPLERPVVEAELRRAALEAGRFLLRLQRSDGRFTYLYDAGREERSVQQYNLPRHAGTAYFLAMLDRLQGFQAARVGALAALRWLANDRVRPCGAAERLCVADGGTADLGSAALTALAAAELLAGGDDPGVRRLLEGLVRFLLSQQRADGEFRHFYDRVARAPVDEQVLFYSGEAVCALVRAYEVLGDGRLLEAARRGLAHLVRHAWSFFGSRYYYGAEHWTCIGAERVTVHGDVEGAAEFCARWAAFMGRVQDRRGATPWASRGALAVGPFVLPQLTPAGSQTEGAISTREMLVRAGAGTAALDAQIEGALGFLLRWQWRPGPVHLFADPAAALGGFPAHPGSLVVRNDYVQHAGSALLRWADVLRRRGTGVAAERPRGRRGARGSGAPTGPPAVSRVVGARARPGV